MRKVLIALSLLLAWGLSGLAMADVYYSQDWEGGNPAGWLMNTVNTYTEYRATGGNPGGYLYSTELTNPGVIGALTAVPEASGDYAAAGVQKLSVDLLFISGDFAEARFRVRYSDPTYNGWSYLLTNSFTLGQWQTYTIEFDPTWSDADAMAAGWEMDASAPTVSFAETMANVYHPEIRVTTVGSAEMGIDNFILETGQAPVVTSEVAFDIKPGGCPNPINIGNNGNGVLPVAILGSENFDVTNIDPSTITIEGVAPLRWSYEDVASPYTDGQNDCDCGETGLDGYSDLSLKFRNSEIAALLNGLVHNDEMMLTISGNLSDGTPFEGHDCVVVKGQNNPDPAPGQTNAGPPEITDLSNYPNPFNPTTNVKFSLTAPAHVRLAIYNVLGQEIEVLVDNQLDAGDYDIPWDASKSASGIYFYRVTSDTGISKSGRMVLMK